MARTTHDVYDEELREVLGDQPKAVRRLFKRPRTGKGFLYLFGGLAVIILAYWGLGGRWVEVIDDTPNFVPTTEAPSGGSQTLHLASGLLHREVEQHGWTANDPFFLPGWALDNMPNYQRGIVDTLQSLAATLATQSDSGDALSQIADDLAQAPDRWLFDFSVSWTAIASSESHYRSAIGRLQGYNTQIAEGAAPFATDAATLARLLVSLSDRLDEAVMGSADHVATAGRLPVDTSADDQFYRTKGRLYGTLILLSGLRVDFSAGIESAGLGEDWAAMMDAMEAAATQHPLIVFHGSPSGFLFPNHLSNQSFALLQAQAILNRIAAELED